MICSTRKQFSKEICAGPRIRWNLGSPAMKCVIERDIRQADRAAWSSFSDRAGVFLDYDYLLALQENAQSTDSFRYCVFHKGSELAGIAVFHITEFQAREIEKNLTESPFSGILQRTLNGVNDRKFILICGNAFSTGEHGFCFRADISPQAAMDALCYALTDVLNEERHSGNRICAVLAKDFYAGSKVYSKALRKCGFREFEVDQSMVLPILPRWNSKADYLNDLTTKFRTKANAALKRSSALTTRDLSADEIRSFQPRIKTLYNQVVDKASFRLGKLDPASFIQLKERLGERMIFRSYFFNEEMVGFLTALIGPEEVEAHQVGIHYEYNQELAIYPRMLYDFVEIGILHRSRRVIFGRTAGEIKSTIGALPVAIQCCIRHPGKISNFLLNWLFAFVRPSTFPLRHPWKSEPASQLREALRVPPFISPEKVQRDR